MDLENDNVVDEGNPVGTLELPAFTWIEHHVRSRDGEHSHIFLLVDGEGRIFARIGAHEDHPMFCCNLFFGLGPFDYGKPTYEQDRAYVELESAKKYCERMAAIAAARPEPTLDDGDLERDAKESQRRAAEVFMAEMRQASLRHTMEGIS